MTESFNLASVLEAEKDHVLRRRPPNGDARDDDLVAVALSGGGVRSGTVSLGLVQELLAAGVLQKTDYLSSVSGGGYASGYLLSAAHSAPSGERCPSEEALFGHEARRRLVKAGRYLARGKGLKGVFRVFQLLGSVICMALINMLWILLLLAGIGVPVHALCTKGHSPFYWLAYMVAFCAVAALVLRLLLLGGVSFFAKILSGFPKLRATLRGVTTELGKALNFLEGCLLVGVVIAVLVLGLAPAAYSAFESLYEFAQNNPLKHYPLIGSFFGLVLRVAALQDTPTALAAVTSGLLVGFFASSDVIGVNVVFRNLIDSAYLKVKPTSKWHPKDLMLSCAEHPALPYPLFGGGMYLRGEKPKGADEGAPRTVGTQVMDYFVLSPLFCGSETSRYAKTSLQPYASTSLADAVAISAASISPLWDGHENIVFRALLFFFNLSLGVWVPNPKLLGRWNQLWFLVRFWPITYLQLLWGKLTTERTLLHVADGGFIDNLGVIELLRRQCRVIIAIDSTYDPHYNFKHLHNVVARAEVELGVAITFAGKVEEELRPADVSGRAPTDHLLALISYPDGSEGHLIYIKACLTGRLRNFLRNAAGERAAAYPAYHEHFPQESTADQFFDEDQWNAYNFLGRQLTRSALATLGLGNHPSRADIVQRVRAAWAGEQARRSQPPSVPPYSPPRPPVQPS
jgi:hypothetical protein